MQRKNNFAVIFAVIKRCLSESSLKGNEHYSLCVRHIETELNNHSYIVKKTTAIPKEISYFSFINYGDVLPQKLEPETLFNNAALHPTNHLQFNITNGIGNKIYEENVNLQNLINRLISPHTLKENRNDSFDVRSNDTFSPLCNYFLSSGTQIANQDDGDLLMKENTNLKFTNLNVNSGLESYEDTSQLVHSNSINDTEKQITEPCHDYPVNEGCSALQLKEKAPYVDLNEIDSLSVNNKNNISIFNENNDHVQKYKNSFSFAKIKELVSKKLSDLMYYNLNLNEISSDNILVLNPKVPHKTTFVYFKDTGVHVIESPHIDFYHEIKNYIKKLDDVGSKETGRLNFIRFYKVSCLNNCFDEILPNSYSNSSNVHLSFLPVSLGDISESCYTFDSASTCSSSLEKGPDNIILKVQESVSLEKNSEKFWIPCEGESRDNLPKNNINCEEMVDKINNQENKCENQFPFSLGHKGVSLKSGPSTTDKVPINKDKLIEETVVPNPSILNIINSIDKSAMIIQKDLYITDQIIQKIQKEDEKQKQKVTDKNKLETSGTADAHILYLDIHSVKDGKITLSLSDLTPDIHNMLLSHYHPQIGKESKNSERILNNKSFMNNNTNKTINDGSECLKERKKHFIVSNNRYNTLLDKNQINESSKNSSGVESYDFQATKKKIHDRKIIWNKHTYHIDANCPEDNKSNIERKVNKLCNTKNDENTLNLNKETNKIFSGDNKCAEISPKGNMNLNTSQTTKNNKLVNNHNTETFKEENNGLSDVAIILKLQSIDYEGNMIFNLTDKSGNFVTMFSSLKKKIVCKQDLSQEYIKSNSQNGEEVKTALLTLKTKNILNLDKCDKKNNTTQSLTKDKHTNSNVLASDKYHKEILPLKESSDKINQNLLRTNFEGYKAEKRSDSETPSQKINIAQHSIKDCCNYSHLMPIESHNKTLNTKNNKEINRLHECLNKTRSSVHKIQNIMDSQTTGSKCHPIMKDNTKSNHLHLPIKENFKEFRYNVTDVNHQKEEVRVNSKKDSLDIKCNLKTLSSNNTYLEKEVQENSKLLKTMLPLPIKSTMFIQNKDYSKECLMQRSNNDKQNIYIPKRKKSRSSASPSSNKSHDYIKKTTITSIKKNNFTDIKVSEVETFVDSRLPVPFSTETFYQIFGTNLSLRDHSTLIDAAKCKLTSPSKSVGYPTNIDVMAKLDDIQKSVHKLNVLTGHPALPKSKDASTASNSLVPSTEITNSSASNQRMIKNNNFDKNIKRENLPEGNKIIGGAKKVGNLNEKLSLQTNKQSNLPAKATSFKGIEKNKLKNLDHKNAFEIKNQDKKTLIQENKSLLILNKNKKNEQEISKEDAKSEKINQRKNNMNTEKAASVDSNKIVIGNYVDLFNFFKNEKDKKKLKFSNPKKSIFDHKGLSKRDKKILRALTKEIPKQKSNLSKKRRRSIRSITSKKAGKEVTKQNTKTWYKQPKNQQLGKFYGQTPESNKKLPVKTNTMQNKNSEPVIKTNINFPKTGIEKNKKLLPQGKQKNSEMGEVKKVDNNKIQDITSNNSFKAKNKAVSDFNKPVIYPVQPEKSHKASSTVTNKATESSTALRSVNKNMMNKQSANSAEGHTNSDTKSIATEKIQTKINYDSSTILKNKKNNKKIVESQNIKFQDHDENLNDEKCNKKPLCHTYIATEAYINQPEKFKTIPDKPLSFPKLAKVSEKNPTFTREPQKVTVLEKYDKTTKDVSNDSEIKEGFKKELIKKSQEKIEHKSNIIFKVRIPKIKNLKSKLTVLKSNTTKGKMSPISGSGRIVPIKRELNKKSDIKNKTLKQKYYSKHKMGNNLKGTQRAPKTTMTKKLELSPVNNIMKKEESSKNNFSNLGSGIPVKEGVHSEKKDDPNKIAISKHDSVISYNEISTEPKLKNNELPKTKSLESPSMEKKKSLDNKEQIKMTTAENKMGPGIQQEPAAVPSERFNKKEFPMLLIDVDKMSKEIKPELDLKNCQKCSVTNDRIIDYPLQNPKKKLIFTPPARILNLGPTRDPMLRKELNFFPSVTKILNSTIPEDSRENLRKWRRTMINDIGENGFKSFYKGQLTNGSKFHSQLHDYLLKGIGHQNDSLSLSMKSVQNVLNKLTHLSAVNSHVVHRKLAYRGVIDCIAKYQNNPVLIEWKRLENPQVKVANSSFDVASIQLSAYIGAINYDDAYKFQLSGGLIVVAYNDGNEAEVVEINKDQCLKHWKEWLQRLQLFHESLHKRQN